MAVSLPPGFVAIDTAKARRSGIFNIMGLVVDELPARSSGGSSFSSTFTLKDNDFSSDPWYGLKVRFFRDVKSELPCPSRGDVVLLRDIRVRDYRGQVIGSAGQKDTATWCILSPSSRDPSGVSITNRSIPPSRDEQSYALSLLNHENVPPGTTPRAPPTPVPARTPAPPSAARQTVPSRAAASNGVPASQKFTLLKDLQYNKFADIVGQVVKTFSEGYSRFTLYVTDYTPNKDLFNYFQDESGEGRDGDEFGYLSRGSKRKWPGPFGQRTIQVTLWDPHAGYARENIKEDDFVLLENVQIKYGRDVAMMEGALRTDRMYPDKVRVRIIDDDECDERVQDVVRRKLDYWKQIGSRTPKRQGADDEQNTANKSKKQRRKEREKQRRQKEKQEKEQREDLEQPKLATTLAKRDELNRLIRASHPATPCRSIQDILENESHKNSAPGGVEYTLPFQNLCYRASVRVVDFFPPKLEDFAVRYSRDRARLGHIDSGSDDEDERNGWEWRFCLLVEDGGPGSHYNRNQKRERMKLFVAGEGAVFLLKMDAMDLRKKDTILAMLREKLFILWGNLEELKSKNPKTLHSDEIPAELSTKPFTCCIKEYGVPSDKTTLSTSDGNGEENGDGGISLGWERRFQIFETTIDE